ncbi:MULTISPECIES: ArsR/SmtB family transcription factor [Acinetobacter]|uniref:Transcriptional regulator n=3 Tax=Acinetobacter haemolyticus TaxID=29430 RepID=A0A1L6KM85_ACIHA|nr:MULTISPECIES: metalloregulator ArsR/SmtB family transcription factor [Acinetobacter]APR70169.1 transcriptional regulator [Acinetobacter haemolyticus]ATZ67447.1 transcriptional regulator [Acinetobacter haemolyticus]AZN69234.1 transcriptional regulator [Acinetobacter haemolyticus]EEH67475.1 transcriptional regulator, ArsR family [Acinetobacter sp. ATCC 27244]EFF82696.1 transcriptional regulator, ArsR family [Acinetobacter haemolyticus ATCC 19194]
MQKDLEIEAMRESADIVVNVLKSLANTDRLIILCHLTQKELNVSQIAEVTKIVQPTLSQQLMMLRKSKVVSTRRDGKQIFYSILDPKLSILLETLYKHYCPQVEV